MVVIVYFSVQPAQLDTPLNCFLVCLRKGSVSVQFHACFHGKSAVFDRLIQLLASSKLGTGRHMLGLGLGLGLGFRVHLRDKSADVSVIGEVCSPS